MVADHGMARGVSGSTYFAEQLRHFAREDALVLQTTNQLELRFFRSRVETDARGGELRK